MPQIEFEKNENHRQRVKIADQQFENYLFGEDVKVVGHNSWNCEDDNDFTKVVYVQYDDEPEAVSHKVSFHVRFGKDNSVSEAYGLIMTTGSEIGVARS